MFLLRFIWAVVEYSPTGRLRARIASFWLLLTNRKLRGIMGQISPLVAITGSQSNGLRWDDDNRHTIAPVNRTGGNLGARILEVDSNRARFRHI